VARSRHRSTIGPKRAIGAFSPKYPSCRTRCPQPTRSCERETLRLELSGNRDQRQHSLQYATTGHPLMSKIITEPVFSASIISHCFHSFKRGETLPAQNRATNTEYSRWKSVHRCQPLVQAPACRDVPTPSDERPVR